MSRRVSLRSAEGRALVNRGPAWREHPDYYQEEPPERDEVCAGCGDAAEFWVDGGWYCYGCASCEVCQSPYCDNKEHRV